MVMFSWKGGRQLTRKEIAREERRGKRVDGAGMTWVYDGVEIEGAGAVEEEGAAVSSGALISYPWSSLIL